MKKPKAAHADLGSGTSMLHFDDGEVMQCYMRGGVCWPVLTERSDQPEFQGFILMCGQDVKTGEVHVFEQERFVVIDHIICQDVIKYYGISAWLNRVWTKYFARDYYWHQPHELHKRYLLQVIRSEMVAPKPQFIEVDWEDDAQAQMIVWEYITLDRVRFPKDSELHRELHLVQMKEKETSPAVYALQCALAGMERFPWRKR